MNYECLMLDYGLWIFRTEVRVIHVNSQAVHIPHAGIGPNRYAHSGWRPSGLV